MDRKLLFGLTVACAVLAGCSDDSVSGGMMKQACPTDGEKTCSQLGEVLTCVDGYYEVQSCGENQMCVDGECTERCDPAHYAGNCDASGNQIICDSNGTLTTQKCEEGNICYKGKCIDKSQETCDTSYTQQCRDDSTWTQCKAGYVVSHPCAAGTICRNGMCEIATPCDPTSFQNSCLSVSTQIICKDGYEKSVPCEGDLVCQNGSCSNACTDDYKECSLDGLTAYFCKNGTIQKHFCSGNEKCIDGSCSSANFCDSSYIPECVDGKRQECSNGTLTITECGLDQECYNGSCVSDPPCDPNTFTPVCTSNSAVQYCKDGYKAKVTCTPDEICDGGICQKADTPCDEGAVECKSATVAKVCVDGMWHEKYCAFGTEVCSSGVCTDQTTVETCNEATTKPSCDENIAKVCENGYLSKYDCGEKHHCDAGVCYEDITEGDPCDASKFTQQCLDDGNVLICANGTVTKVPCGDKVCANGACSDPTCDPGTFKASCNGITEAVQCKNGVVTKTACSENEYCVDGECKPGGNVGDPCDPNTYAKSCQTDGKLLECVKGDDDNYKIVETTCSEGTPVCLNGACVQCDPSKYEMTCSEGKKWTCEADGSLKDTLCPANKNVCYNNDCAECDPTKTAKSCDGTDSYKMCNASGLFETKKCPDSYTCQDAGNCTNTCDDDHPCTAEHYVCDEGKCKFQAECVNTEPVTCSEDNKSIKKCVDELYEYTSCGATEVCKNGACIGNECDPDTYGKETGGKACADANNWAICDKGYLKKTKCPEGEVCKNGACIGDECDPDTFGTQCKADGVTQTFCQNGHIVDYGKCSGEKGICVNGACVECDSSKTSVKCSGTAQYQVCTDNKYSTPLYCDLQSETCKDGKGCVSMCGDDFKNHCDENGKRVYCDGTSKTIKTEECSFDATCVGGKCESRSGKPCAIHEFKNECHVNSKTNKVILEECSDLGTIRFGECGTNAFCGEIQGLSDCYTGCDTENQTTCLYSSLKADIGKCLKGTEVKADGSTTERLGIYTVSGICEDDNLSISCHPDSGGHPVFDYFFCSTLNGGGTCQTSTGACSQFVVGSCGAPDGQCINGVATNCVKDPALDGYVMTQMNCPDYVVNNTAAKCVTYTLDGVKTAKCLGSHEFNFSGNKYDVSTLGTCIGTKTLATMYWSDKGAVTSHSSGCNTSCEEGTTDSGEKFHYCK